jgi:hypothetical protein
MPGIERATPRRLRRRATAAYETEADLTAKVMAEVAKMPNGSTSP